MATVIGWAEEANLADCVIALARGLVSADELADIDAHASAGEVEGAVSCTLEHGTPIDEELATEIRTAWIDGRAWDDRTVRRARLARALTAAGATSARRA
ncbi:hypothetical protein ACFJIY_08570 [Pimelobacter simplex]|uniref:hypothetical protein n=1 Tax=Nocardioides simplex TaxID=2045 RepID=UPI003671028E